MTDTVRTSAVPLAVFILGGAAESIGLARALDACGHAVTLALEAPPRSGGALPEVPVGEIAEEDSALVRHLRTVGADVVIDATHPFSEVPQRAVRLCRELGLPYLRLRRPAWEPGPGDRWTVVEDVAQAARLLPAGERVFVTTGRDSLDGFAGLRDGHLFVRQLGPHRPVPEIRNATFRFETGPFSAAHEQALFTELGITALVCNNSGGVTSRSKLDAARALGLQVFLRARPPSVSGVQEVSDIDAALEWVAAQ